MPNIVLIGAGSACFSLDLIRDIVNTDGLAGSTLALVDIDPQRLQVAHTLAIRLCAETGGRLELVAVTDRREALVGADFVISAVKIGGYGPLEEERKIAEEAGYYRGIGDRVSCYYGGIGAYHQFRFLMGLARDMEELCPEAWLIQTANPVFDGTNLITRQTNLKTVGVCHGHFAFCHVADTLGLDLEDTDTQMAGFNHYIFLTQFRYQGKDAYPLIDRWIENESAALWRDGDYVEEMSPGAIDAYRLYGLFPIGDATRCATPWWHHISFEEKKRWYGNDGGFDSEIRWAEYLDRKPKVQENLARLAGEPGASLLEEFPLKRHSEQHIQIIDAMANDHEMHLQLNVPNRGAIEGIPDDVLVEIPVVVNGRGIQNVPVGRLPPLIVNNVLLPRLARMENLHDAFLRGDRRPLLLSLMDDPRTRTFEQARDLIDTILAQPWNKEADEHYRMKEYSA